MYLELLKEVIINNIFNKKISKKCSYSLMMNQKYTFKFNTIIKKGISNTQTWGKAKKNLLLAFTD